MNIPKVLIVEGPIFYYKVKMVLRIQSIGASVQYLRHDIGAQADLFPWINVEVGERDPQGEGVLDEPRLSQKPCEQDHDQLEDKDQPQQDVCGYDVLIEILIASKDINENNRLHYDSYNCEEQSCLKYRPRVLLPVSLTEGHVHYG